MLAGRCPVLPVCLSVCDVRALWPNGWTDQDETWHAGRPRSWPHCVTWNPAPPPLKGHNPLPQFSAHICCGQMDAWIKMSLGMEVGLGPGDCARWGRRSPPQKGGRAPSKFSAHVYCGQTDGWMKLVLGMEIGLSPGDFVLDGDPVPFPKRGRCPSPIFGPFLLWPNGCMHQTATWYRARPRPRRICVRWGPRSPVPQRGTDPQFSAHCCGQMAAWIKMSLGMELGLEPGDVVLDGDHVAPSPKGGRTSQIFGPCLL